MPDNKDELIQELIDWNYGTVYKGYDNEELTEVLEEDTRAYISKIIEANNRNQLKSLKAKLPEKKFTIAEIFGEDKNHYNAHTSSFREGADYGYRKAIALLDELIGE